MRTTKLDIEAFSLAAGLWWGFGLFVITWWIMLFEGVTKEKTFFGRVYRGYEISPKGSIVGLLWALADATAGGAIFAWLYNRILVGESSPVPVSIDK